MGILLKRVIFGLLLILSAFLPLGRYHYFGPLEGIDIKGTLWAFMLPVGYLSAAFGLFILLYPKKPKQLAYSLILASVAILLTAFLQGPRLGYFLSLWHGTPGGYDVDGYPFILGYMVALVFFAGLIELRGMESKEVLKKLHILNFMIGGAVGITAFSLLLMLARSLQALPKMVIDLQQIYLLPSPLAILLLSGLIGVILLRVRRKRVRWKSQ